MILMSCFLTCQSTQSHGRNKHKLLPKLGLIQMSVPLQVTDLLKSISTNFVSQERFSSILFVSFVVNLKIRTIWVADLGASNHTFWTGLRQPKFYQLWHPPAIGGCQNRVPEYTRGEGVREYKTAYFCARRKKRRCSNNNFFFIFCFIMLRLFSCSRQIFKLSTCKKV